MDKHSAILITGAGGFVGKNLCAALRCRGYDNLLMFDLDTPKEALREYAQQAAFVFHLAGVNRPKDPSEFYAATAALPKSFCIFWPRRATRRPCW